MPGTLGHPDSLINESHNSPLLEYPQYTRPQVFRNMKVPDVLISGNHKEIELWREEQMLRRTFNRRKDLLKSDELKKFNFDVITLFPKAFELINNLGVITKALDKNLIDVNLHDLREYGDCLLYTSPSPRDFG